MKQKKGPGGEPGQGQETGNTNNLRNYNTTNDRTLQVPIYPPGWLIARLRLPLAPNPISRAQGRALHNLIQIIGLAAYRAYKVQLGIPLDVALHRLSKQQAWRLIDAITTDLEASRP